MKADDIAPAERTLLGCLLAFYREFGPAATPAIAGLDEEAGIGRWELDEAVKALRARGWIEYWELQPAVRLTEHGLRAALHLDGSGGA